MTWTDALTGAGETWTPSGEDESLWLTSPFASRESESAELEDPMSRFTGELLAHEGPFASPFQGLDGPSMESGAIGELLEELRVPEFEDVIAELVQESAALHAERGAVFAGETSGASAAAEAVREHLLPLEREADRLLEQLAEMAGDREAGSIGEDEADRLAASFTQVELPPGVSPASEEFLKSLRRVAGKAVSAAVGLARKGISAIGKVIPIGAILQRLKGLIKPLLRRVLSVAINRLPLALRPAANRLRQRLLKFEDESVLAEAEELAELLSADETPAVASLEVLHEDFTMQLADMLMAEDGEALEAFDAETAFEATAQGERSDEAGGSAGDLDAARIRLIRELGELEDGESPAPAFEEFLPALLPALRIGIRIAGRDRVIRLLAGFLAKPLQRFVGPRLSRPLSTAVIDTGLRLLTLESPNAEDERLAGPAALAAVVEETGRAVLAEDSEFEDPARLETAATMAFNEAVARNFPPALLKADLLELETSGSARAVWVLRPRGYSYKKYTRIFETTVTPQIAASVTSFGGTRLDAQLRASGAALPARARVHLYEALPGNILSRIAALEKHVPGMDWRQLHPLTVQAATALLGEPGLGKDVGPRFTANRNMIATGQRFYFLEAAGRPGGGGGGGGGRIIQQSPPSQAFVELNGRPGKNWIRLYIFISEPEAQAIASRIRKGDTTAMVLALRAAWGAAIRSVMSSPTSRVRILSEASPMLEQQVAAAAAGIASKVAEMVVGKLLDAAVRLGTDYAKLKAGHFADAADAPALGVTVVLTFPVPGLGAVLRGGIVPSLATVGLLRTIASFATGRVLPAMDTQPGFIRTLTP